MPENDKLIAVFCTAEIPPNVCESLLLSTFLDEAYSAQIPNTSYAFMTSKDPTAPLTAARSPVQSSVKSPGIEVCGNAVMWLEEYNMPDVDSTFFVLLDEHSLQPERGCVISNAKNQNYVRCEFGISLPAIEALRCERKRWPDLWLDAALSGGVIPLQSHIREAQPVEYQSYSDTREEVKRCIEIQKQREYAKHDVKKDQPFAVFVTADVPVSILNELLTKCESHDFKGLCFLDTLEPNDQMKTTIPPIPDNFTSPFLGKDFSYILQFVTDVIPDTSLQNEAFLVVDSFALPSLSSKPSVLHVDTKGSWENHDIENEDGELLWDCFASRESFRTAFTSLLESLGSLDEYAVEGALKGGIYDY